MDNLRNGKLIGFCKKCNMFTVHDVLSKEAINETHWSYLVLCLKCNHIHSFRCETNFFMDFLCKSDIEGTNTHKDHNDNIRCNDCLFFSCKCDQHTYLRKD